MGVHVIVNAGELLANIDIGVTQYTDALSGKVGGTCSVVAFLCRVAIAVDFDDELQFGTVEIGNIRTDRFLAQKFVPVKLAVAQEFLPDRRFGRRGVLAVDAGEGGQAWVVGEVFGV